MAPVSTAVLIIKSKLNCANDMYFQLATSAYLYLHTVLIFLLPSISRHKFANVLLLLRLITYLLFPSPFRARPRFSQISRKKNERRSRRGGGGLPHPHPFLLHPIIYLCHFLSRYVKKNFASCKTKNSK